MDCLNCNCTAQDNSECIQCYKKEVESLKAKISELEKDQIELVEALKTQHNYETCDRKQDVGECNVCDLINKFQPHNKQGE